MGVDLRRSQALVTEQLLHNSEVSAAVEEVCRKRVAKCVWVKCLWETSGTRDVVQSRARAALSQWPAISV